MNEQDIKPFVPISWHVHSHTVTSKFKMYALVFDIADTIKPQMRRAFSEKNRSDGYTRILRFGFGVRDWKVKFAHII